jgi:hypothetical protein
LHIVQIPALDSHLPPDLSPFDVPFSSGDERPPDGSGGIGMSVIDKDDQGIGMEEKVG